MNFVDKIASNKEDRLDFLKELGFYKDEKNRYCNEYYSGNKLYYNRVTVFIDEGIVKVENYQEFDFGGETGFSKDKMKIEELTKDKVVALIGNVLPSDLD